MAQSFILPKALPRAQLIGRIASYLSALPNDKAWRVDIAEQKRRRSDQQNKYWWSVVVGTFCQRLEGWEPDDVHCYLCGEHFGWHEIHGLGRKRIKPIRTSSKLSKIEFSELVATAQRIGAVHNIYIPDPNEAT